MFKTYFGDFKSIYFSYNMFDGNRFAMSIKIFNFFTNLKEGQLERNIKLIERKIKEWQEL